MVNTGIAILFSIIITFENVACGVEKITYIGVEHPRVTFRDPKYLSFLNVTSKRYGRASPVYYMGLHFSTLFTLDNNVTAMFDFYELLSNQYKPSFVRMSFSWCDLIHKDSFFGAAMKQGRLEAPCPYSPGDFHLLNMTVNPDVIPRGFPFTKGRIYVNITRKKVLIASLHGNMELRQLKVANRIKYKKL